MNASTIVTHIRAIAALSEHVNPAPPDVGVVDALIAARTLVEIVQDRCYGLGLDSVALDLEPATEIIDRAIGTL
jgi:hypothetical protein